MYGDIIGQVTVDMNFDEYMTERVKEAFEANDRDDVEVEECVVSNIIYVKSTKRLS